MSADSASTEHLVWLLRTDLRATMTVDPVHLDSDARNALSNGALIELAQLQIAMESGVRPVSVVRRPVLQPVNGRQVCVYEVARSPSGDVIRTVLVDAGARVYAVRALSEGGKANGTLEVVQQGFVRQLRW